MLSGEAEFGIDNIQLHTGRDSVYPQITFASSMYSHTYVFITRRPRLLSPMWNMVDTFDAGTWTFSVVSLVVATFAFVIVAASDEGLKISMVGVSLANTKNFTVFLN